MWEHVVTRLLESLSGGGGGNRFGGGNNFKRADAGPPERVIPVGYFDYACQDDLVVKITIEDVPYFNAPIFLENKEQVGKIDEIFGNLRDYYVTVKLGENMKATSFKSQQKVGFVSIIFIFILCTKSNHIHSKLYCFLLSVIHWSKQIVAVKSILTKTTTAKRSEKEGTSWRREQPTWWRWI